MLVLALGDLHIPLRTHDLPSKFKKLLVRRHPCQVDQDQEEADDWELRQVPGKIQQIVCTGNVCDRETWEYLRGVAPDVRGVRGEYDENPALPPSLVLQHGPLKIGVLHGHQVVPLGDTEALSAVARKMDVDVLISGGTHRFEAFEYDSRFFVNPGSATGAFSPLWTPPAASSTTTNPTASSSSPHSTSTGDAAPNGSSSSSSSAAKADSTANGAKSPAPSADGTTTSTTASSGGDASAAAGAATTTTSTTIIATGASGTVAPKSTYPPSPIPSFALLDIQGTVVTLYVYQLIESEVKVEKISFRKQVP